MTNENKLLSSGVQVTYKASGRSYLSVELVQNVLEVVTLDRFFWVEKLEEFLHELGCNIHFERADFDTLIDHQLQEELIYSLKVRPGRIHVFLSFDASLGETETSFFDVREWPENVFLDHLNNFIQIGDDQTDNIFLVLEELLQLVDGLEAVGLDRINANESTRVLLTLPFTSLVSSL